MNIYQGYYQSLIGKFDKDIVSFQKVIVLDLKRTGANVISDETREVMGRILTNYCKRNMDVAYCQGFNFICYFLIQLKFKEEEIFWIICKILDELIPQNYYIHMIPAMVDAELFGILIEKRTKQFSEKLKEQKIDLNFFLIPNFITIFTNYQNYEVILKA